MLTQVLAKVISKTPEEEGGEECQKGDLNIASRKHYIYMKFILGE